jgi:hypothetical protein
LQFSGEICREVTHQRYNPKVLVHICVCVWPLLTKCHRFARQGRRYDPVRHDVWSSTPGWYDSGDRIYGASSPSMQVYAAHTYRRAYVQAVKVPSLVRAVPLNTASHILTGSRELEPFAMPGCVRVRRQNLWPTSVIVAFVVVEAFAWDMCQSRIAGLEAKEAVSALKDRFFRVL